MQAAPNFSGFFTIPFACLPALGPPASSPAHWMRGLASLSVRKLGSFPLPILAGPKGQE